MFKPSEVLPSLNQENLISNEIFAPEVYHGLYVKSETSLSDDSFFTSELFLQPLKINIGRGPKGELVKRANQTTAAKFTYVLSNPNGKILSSFGTNPFLLVVTHPIKQISLISRVQYSNGKIKPVLSTSFSHKWFHPTFKLSLTMQPLVSISEANRFKFFQFSDVESLDFSIMVGRHNFSAGFQYIKWYSAPQQKTLSKKEKSSYSALIQRKWGKNSLIFAFIHDKPAPPNIVWRYNRTINSNWKAGIQFSMDTTLDSYCQAAYSGEIGNNKLGGTINSNGLVVSSFQRKISNNFTFGLSTSLNHEIKDYKLGISLEFDNQ